MFGCPVYLCGDDERWLNRKDKDGVRKLVKGVTEIEEIGGEAKMIQCGGHFDGSSVLWWDKKLFIADTFMSVPVSSPLFGLAASCGFGEISRANEENSLASTTHTAYQIQHRIRSCGRILT